MGAAVSRGDGSGSSEHELSLSLLRNGSQPRPSQFIGNSFCPPETGGLNRLVGRARDQPKDNGGAKEAYFTPFSGRAPESLQGAGVRGGGGGRLRTRLDATFL